MVDYKVSIFDNNLPGTKLFVAKNKKFLGCIVIRDEIKSTARTAVTKLKEFNIKPVMITGDTNEQVEKAPKFSEIADEFLSFIGSDPLVIHNAPFDMTVYEPLRIVINRDIVLFIYIINFFVSIYNTFSK